MHEGVIIVNKPKQMTGKRKIVFSNKPAQKLTDYYIVSNEESLDILSVPTFSAVNVTSNASQ